MELYNQYPNHVKIIRFRKNFGKSIALNIGFKKAKGDVIFTMDADLQDDPSEIKNFIDTLNSGYDLVSGWKKERKDPWHKRYPSKLFNFVISRIAGLKLHDFNCGFKCYTSAACHSVVLYGELHRFIPAIVNRNGFRVTEIPVKHNPRTYGVSKFGIERLYRGLFDAITVLLTTRYIRSPLHFFGGIGMLIGGAGFCMLLYLTIIWFMNESIGGRPLLIVSILFIITGIQIFSIGLIAEMIIHTRYLSQKREEKAREDNYIIEKMIEKEE